MNFPLDEKKVYEEINQLWQSEDHTMKEAIVSKGDELEKYNKLVRLYGAESMNLVAVQPLLPQHKCVSVNKIMEHSHSISIENKLLNFFIFIFSVFCMFQMILILIIKFNLELPTLEIICYGVIFHYTYLTILIMGKSLTYLFMLTFFFRIYVGIKIFKNFVTTNVLLRLINLQFIGFLTSSLIIILIMGSDMILKMLLTQLEVIDDGYVDGFLGKLIKWTSYTDMVFYSTIAVGLLLTTTRKLAR
jgi:hypothetical protein